jgi:hypothetical protein
MHKGKNYFVTYFHEQKCQSEIQRTKTFDENSMIKTVK